LFLFSLLILIEINLLFSQLRTRINSCSAPGWISTSWPSWMSSWAHSIVYWLLIPSFIHSIPVSGLIWRDYIIFITCVKLFMMIELPFLMSINLLNTLGCSCIVGLHHTIKIPRSSQKLVKNMVSINHCAHISIEL
jgi:hypothetical protein